MFLVLSGEGASDIGIDREQIGPMTKWVDRWMARRCGYSVVEYQAYTIVPKSALAERAKQMKPRSRKGKKQRSETRYFYNNARALALLAGEMAQADVVAVLFRDGDGTASSDRGEWHDKVQSVLDGFAAERMLTGVPMIPKPKSEAWLLCALRDGYRDCGWLEDESGNDASPNSLKQQIKQHLGEPATRELLNGKIDDNRLDLDRITDMPSLTMFKCRLDEVLDALGCPRVKL